VTEDGRHLRLSDQVLATPDAWSNAWGISADGSVIVGDLGPSNDTL